MVITVAVLVVNSVLGLEQELAVTHLVSSENSSTRNILIHLCRWALLAHLYHFWKKKWRSKSPWTFRCDADRLLAKKKKTVLLLIKNVQTRLFASCRAGLAPSLDKNKRRAATMRPCEMLVCSFLFFPSAGAQLAARDNIVCAAALRHFTDSQSWAVGVCDWVGVARCVCVCLCCRSSAVCRTPVSVWQPQMFRLSDVRVGNGGHGGFQDVAFFHPRWIFVTLSTFPPFMLLFFIYLFFFLQNRLVRSIYSPSFQTLGHTCVTLYLFIHGTTFPFHLCASSPPCASRWLPGLYISVHSFVFLRLFEQGPR